MAPAQEQWNTSSSWRTTDARSTEFNVSHLPCLEEVHFYVSALLALGHQTHSTSDTRWRGVANTTRFWETSWVSYRLTQFWHHLPGDGIRSHRWRALSHETAPRSDVGRDVELPCVLRVFTFTSLQAPQPHTLGILREAASRRRDRSRTAFPAPQPFPENGGWGFFSGEAESSKLLIMAASFWWPVPIQKPTKHCLIWRKDSPITQEVPRDLGVLCQEPGDPTPFSNNIYFFNTSFSGTRKLRILCTASRPNFFRWNQAALQNLGTNHLWPLPQPPEL